MEVYKSANNCIVTLKLLTDTQHTLQRSGVVDTNYAKFRCSKALVLSIEHKDTNELLMFINSNYNPSFEYQVGKIVIAEDYDTNTNNICSHGIHFYLTKEPAYFYQKEVPNCEYKSWYDNGQLSIHYIYNDDQSKIKANYWYENGQLSTLSIYDNGGNNGECTHWHKNGQLSKHYTFVDEKYEGYYEEWNEIGQLHVHRVYINGQKQN
jgi:antitoxin component YwqK of YwqJK toxin-antitoxin module